MPTSTSINWSYNLQGDRELALSGARAFLESFIMAIPKAKQNGTAAQSLPSFVMIVVRDKGLASLANAFAGPSMAATRV